MCLSRSEAAPPPAPRDSASRGTSVLIQKSLCGDGLLDTPHETKLDMLEKHGVRGSCLGLYHRTARKREMDFRESGLLEIAILREAGEENAPFPF